MVPENDNLKWLVLRYVADSVRCARCHHNFEPDEVSVLSRQDDMWFIGISCDVCGIESMALVILETRSSDLTIMPASDLRTMDSASFDAATNPSPSSLGPITGDEIEKLHRFLQDYHGDLSEFWDIDD